MGAVVVMARVHQQLGREVLGTDLDRKGMSACGHEAQWNECARGERKQHRANNHDSPSAGK